MFTFSGKVAAGQLMPRSRKTVSSSKSSAAATALRIVEPDSQIIMTYSPYLYIKYAGDK